MPATRIAAVLTAIVCLLIAFHTFYFDLWETPLKYGGLPWLYKNSRNQWKTQLKGDEYLIGVGKADITGYAL